MLRYQLYQTHFYDHGKNGNGPQDLTHGDD